MLKRIVFFVASVALGSACYLTPQTNGTAPAGGSAITFHKDVEPILQQHCDGCHVAGGIAPFSLVSYSDAKPYAQDIVTQTTARIMPPWGAQNTSECTTRSAFKGDPSLSDAQIQTLTDWASQGALEGDAADAPPPFSPPPGGLPGVQADLAPSAGFVLPADESQDQFQCFVLDPKITTTTYVNGTAVLPGNSLIVHHAILFTDPGRQSPGLVTDPQTNSYPCFGGPGVSNSSLVAAWAPGGLPHDFPSNVGMPLSPNTLFVLQIHYHPHTTDPKNQDPDITHVQLRYTSAAPQYYAVSKIVGNFSTAAQGLQPGPDDPTSTPVFDIPPNVSGHTETMIYTVPTGLTNGKPAWIYSIGGHMHLVGSDIKVTLDRKSPTSSDPANECLMQIPQWNFDWQRQYDYDLDITKLPSIASGDKVTIRCTYDNTMDNVALASELSEQGESAPVDVHLGESTLDEMCLAIVTAVVPAQ